MSIKLTLSMEKDVILRAKKFAQSKQKSLSKIIEDYLVELTKSETKTNFNKKLPPLTRELAGILKNKQPINPKIEIAKFLEKKYK